MTMNIQSARAVGVACAALLVSSTTPPRAHAFGGVWSSRSAPVVQAAQRVIFVDNPDATITALVQLAYEGPAAKFAWLVPVPGRPTVSVSSTVVFDRLDAATAPQHWTEVSDESAGHGGMCVPHDDAQAEPSRGAAWPPRKPDSAGAPVELLDRRTIGPYDYVLIASDPRLADPSQAASDWLTANGYEVTARERELLGPYFEAGFNLLAFRLGEGKGRGAIRPVSLTYESPLPRIPLVPAAVAALADLSIQVWIFGPSQAVPDNYRSLVLNDAMIDWQQGQRYAAGMPPAGGGGPTVPFFGRPSNYDAVVSEAANEAGGRGFVTELAEPASQFRDAVWSGVDAGNFEALSSETYADGIDAILAADTYYGGWDGWREAVSGATSLPADVTLDAFVSNPAQFRGAARVDTSAFFRLLQDNVIAPVASTAALFFKGPYLTRLYSTMSADEMTVDPIFNYNFDLTQISNVHVARQSYRCDSSQSQANAPWRMELPQGGVVTGAGAGPWPIALRALPSNLKVVQLSTSGPGTVTVDNSGLIASTLFGAAPPVMETIIPRPPQTGSAIGGTQRVDPPEPLASRRALGRASGESTRASATTPPADGCQISRVGGCSGARFVLWLPVLAAMMLTRRRRRER